MNELKGLDKALDDFTVVEIAHLYDLINLIVNEYP